MIEEIFTHFDLDEDPACLGGVDSGGWRPQHTMIGDDLQDSNSSNIPTSDRPRLETDAFAGSFDPCEATVNHL